jgi:hypothetical protein
MSRFDGMPRDPAMLEVKEWIRRYKEEVSAATVAQGFAILALLCLLVLILRETYQTATVRDFYLIEVGCVLIMTCFVTLYYKAKLGEDAAPKADRESKEEKDQREERQKKLKSTVKLEAELFGAVAILSFFLTFYRMGVELDRANHTGRIAHLETAAAYIESTKVCASLPRLKEKCESLDKGYKNVAKAIRADDEKAVQAGAEQLKRDVVDVIVASRKERLDWFDYEVDSALVKDDRQIMTMSILSATLFFSAMAISRKVALSWFEKTG